MNYAELKQTILDYAHRPDLADEVAGFVRLAEGMIAREVRSVEQINYATLTDAERVEGAIFQLPDRFLEARVFYAPQADGRSRELENKSLAEIRRLRKTAAVQWYAIKGNTVEFRGGPGEDTEIELDYFERLPALDADEDTNALLEAHELYVAASLFFLHRYTQDLELAQGHLDSYGHARDTLNEQAARQIGGASVAPAYNFSFRSSY